MMPMSIVPPALTLDRALLAVGVGVEERVLRRSADGRDELAFAVVDKPVEIEQTGVFHQRIGLLLQEVAVAA